MTENIALYRRLGFVETGRGQEAGYDRVFMTRTARRRLTRQSAASACKLPGLIGERDRMTVAAPPIEPAKQLFDAKSQLGKFERAFGRRVAADPVAIDDVNLGAVEPRCRLRRHISVRQAQRAWNMGGIGLARTSIDDDSRRVARFQIDRQVPGIGMEPQLVGHQGGDFARRRNAIWRRDQPPPLIATYISIIYIKRRQIETIGKTRLRPAVGGD